MRHFSRKITALFIAILCFATFGSFNYAVGEQTESGAAEVVAAEETAALLDVQGDEQVENTETVSADETPRSEVRDAVYDEESGEYITPDFDEDWCLILVNRTHLIPEDYEMELGTIMGNVKSDTRIIDSVLDMIKGAREDGVVLSICSPYRDYDRQTMLYSRKVKSYMSEGYTEEEANELAGRTIAVPGASEHEIGLAFDFISSDYTRLDEGFADTDAGRWLKEHSKEYGFILRYPGDKTDITGIDFEPWHYRYVGLPAAAKIMDSGLCLEEYLEEIGY